MSFKKKTHRTVSKTLKGCWQGAAINDQVWTPDTPRADPNICSDHGIETCAFGIVCEHVCGFAWQACSRK